ncbi:MAG: hypothetical protein IJU72_08400 [Bacteroidales bacterium]|nr:hypothetical protein [Bacteroidales bacterium]
MDYLCGCTPWGYPHGSFVAPYQGCAHDEAARSAATDTAWGIALGERWGYARWTMQPAGLQHRQAAVPSAVPEPVEGTVPLPHAFDKLRLPLLPPKNSRGGELPASASIAAALVPQPYMLMLYSQGAMPYGFAYSLTTLATALPTRMM